ncbi:phospholipid phosphatase 1-like [Mercenaria mercenaria]|uniref:phospholipid phosphatase 1-like n=1 Tax=Mercenaria mercenaria TaxID=6596 RepID=UPI00234F8193|nr:phospholipid phosphatase 1-like [Mercenaria mercenaria]
MPKCAGQLRRHAAVQIILDILIWLAVAVSVLFLFLHGTPYKRGFYCGDVTLSFPFKQDTLSTPLLLMSGVIVSVVVVVITEVLNHIDTKCRQQCVSAASVVYCVKSYAIFLAGFILQQLVVEVVKNRTGVLRPNFFDVCKPQFNTSLCPSYITRYTCTGDDQKEIRNSRLSFPSGHSSLSMYIAVFFCMYIENRLQISFSRILKLFLQASLILMAILCGVDRIIDNKHHPSDVAAGFLLGVIVAVVMYHQVCWKYYKTTEEMQLHCNENRSCGCCGFLQSPNIEVQTSTNDDVDGLTNSNNTTVSTKQLIASPFNIRRHFSTPVTPTRWEDVV